MDIDKDFIIKYKDETLNIGIKFKKILKYLFKAFLILACIGVVSFIAINIYVMEINGF